MDWKACNMNDMVKSITIDKSLIKSLKDSSAKKLETQSMLELNDTTASSKLSLLYESLRELLEALAISEGYKIYNHQCYVAFLKEILDKPNLAETFDRFRRLRNQINYYGKDVSKEEASDLIDSMLKFISQIKELLS
ncbi:hypothetical protein KY330_00550 [Candidatus Woesearchaeota archaeon]|nr:hypothetical protein [Candidatus Woesearchaeota archaeon]